MSMGPNGGVLVFLFENQEKAEKVLNQVSANIGCTWDYIRYRVTDNLPWFEAPQTYIQRLWVGLDPTDYTLTEFFSDFPWIDPCAV